jgi:dienelactone hydrolase
MAAPNGGGALVVASRGDDGVVRIRTPSGHSVRSRVQGYGGGAFCVHQGVIFYVNDADQRIYQVAPGQAPRPITHGGALAYGDLSYDPGRARILCVRERCDAAGVVVTQVVSVAADGCSEMVLASGADFYAAPRLSPCGTMLALIRWDFPAMPWDGSILELLRLDPAGSAQSIEVIDGGADVSIIEPHWSACGALLYLSDRGGWWNPHGWRGAGSEVIYRSDEEFGFPPYRLGQYSYASAATDGATRWPELYACSYRDGRPGLLKLAGDGAIRRDLDGYGDARYLQTHAGKLWFIHAAEQQPCAIVAIDLASGAAASFMLGSMEAAPPPVRRVRFGDGPQRAHGNLYLPPAGVPPDSAPLLVNIHGGPTGHAATAWNPAIAFWTARGYAYLDLNHRGSTGFGRRYRDALNGQWGVAEVADAVLAVRELVAAGVADPKRVAIRGNSAGGYTVLRALTSASPECFVAGACYYGVADLAHLHESTHKFESRYLERLIGPYPEARALFAERSPLFSAAACQVPVLFLQGALDRIVPPDQTAAMAAQLAAIGRVAPRIEFADEGHGFSQAASVRSALEAEHYFYCRAFGQTHNESLAPELRSAIDAAFDGAGFPHQGVNPCNHPQTPGSRS